MNIAIVAAIVFGVLWYTIWAAYLHAKRVDVERWKSCARRLKVGMAEDTAREILGKAFDDGLSPCPIFPRSDGTHAEMYTAQCPGVVLPPIPVVLARHVVCVRLTFRDGVLIDVVMLGI